MNMFYSMWLPVVGSCESCGSDHIESRYVYKELGYVWCREYRCKDCEYEWGDD